MTMATILAIATALSGYLAGRWHSKRIAKAEQTTVQAQGGVVLGYVGTFN